MLSRFLSIFLLCPLLMICLPGGINAAQLEPSDCQKCHSVQIAEIADKGGKHRDEIGCTDCHLEHPPKGLNAIPECSMCHVTSGNPHFASPNCLNCHNPHAPLEIDLTKARRVRPACMTCHPNPAEELSDYPSNHSVLDCNECHRQHGEYLSCLECHDPHLTGQTYANCRQCHKPHMPLKVAYENTLESAVCIVCHEQPGADLAENTTKHARFLCVYCHKFQHKTIPACRTCHGQPHFDELHETYPACIHCHVGPHNLVN